VFGSDNQGIAQGSLPLLALLTIVFCCAVAGVVAAWF